MKQDKEKFEHIKEGMVEKNNVNQTESMRQVADKLKKVIEQKKLTSVAEVKYDADGMQIELKNKLLFKSGSFALNENFDKAAHQIIKLLTKLGNNYQIKIEGHTDDVPYHDSAGHFTNWELSAARGFAMMRKLQEAGIKENHLSVVAYAHTRPKVPYEGLKAKALERARAANRRVIIRIE